MKKNHEEGKRIMIKCEGKRQGVRGLKVRMKMVGGISGTSSRSRTVENYVKSLGVTLAEMPTRGGYRDSSSHLL